MNLTEIKYSPIKTTILRVLFHSLPIVSCPVFFSCNFKHRHMRTHTYIYSLTKYTLMHKYTYLKVLHTHRHKDENAHKKAYSLSNQCRRINKKKTTTNK